MSEIEILNDYLATNGLRQGSKRETILKEFLRIEKHLTVDELLKQVKKIDTTIGQASVYRAMKIFVECGISRELQFSDGTRRYEHLYEHDHHDHLICEKCGSCIEIIDNKLEKLKHSIAVERGFVLTNHKLQMYGVCTKCQK